MRPLETGGVTHDFKHTVPVQVRHRRARVRTVPVERVVVEQVLPDRIAAGVEHVHPRARLADRTQIRHLHDDFRRAVAVHVRSHDLRMRIVVRVLGPARQDKRPARLHRAGHAFEHVDPALVLRTLCKERLGHREDDIVPAVAVDIRQGHRRHLRVAGVTPRVRPDHGQVVVEHRQLGDVQVVPDPLRQTADYFQFRVRVQVSQVHRHAPAAVEPDDRIVEQFHMLRAGRRNPGFDHAPARRETARRDQQQRQDKRHNASSWITYLQPSRDRR